METIKETGLIMARIIEEHDGLRLLERSPAAFYGILIDLVTDSRFEVAKKLIKKGIDSGVYTRLATASEAERQIAIIDGISVLTTRELLSEEYARKAIGALLIAMDTSEGNIRYVEEELVGCVARPVAPSPPPAPTPEPEAPAPRGGRFGNLRPGGGSQTTSGGGTTVSSTSGVRLGGRFGNHGGQTPAPTPPPASQTNSESGVKIASNFGSRHQNTDMSDFEIEGDTLVRYLGSGGDVHIPLAIKNIGKFAFQNCTALTSVSFPAGLKTIGASAFYGCTGLTTVSIPHNVEEIGTYAFFGCTNITSMRVPDDAIVRNNALKGVSGIRYY